MNDFVNPPNATRELTDSQKRAIAQTMPAMPPTLAHDDIARRAYDIYVRAGSKTGHCTRNWMQAEHELKSRALATVAAPDTRDQPSETDADLTPTAMVAGGLHSIKRDGRHV